MENSFAARGKAFSASVSATLTCRRQLSVVRERLFRAAAQPFLWGGRDRLKVRKRLFRNAERAVSHCRDITVMARFCAMNWLSVIYQKGTIPAYLHRKVRSCANTRLSWSWRACLCVLQPVLMHIYADTCLTCSESVVVRSGGWRGARREAWHAVAGVTAIVPARQGGA